MLLSEIEKYYYLHDSALERVARDKEKQTATFTVELCCWMQPGYKKGDPENELIQFTFWGVDSIKSDIPSGSAVSLSILSCESPEEGALIFWLVEDRTQEFYSISISAKSVEVRKPCGPVLREDELK